jgi:O-antigen/teichoic acid export membrane protein
MEWTTDRSLPLFVSDRIARWSRLFLEFAVSQGIGQAAGMISGLIYVRLMPVDQYALYAIALTALGFVGTASDLGLNGAISYFWRQSVTNDSVMKARIVAVRRLRSAFLVLVSLLCGALLLKTAAKQDIAATTMLGCFGLIVATAWAQMHASIGIHLLRLQNLQRQSYYCEVAGGVTRLLAAVAMIVTGITTALFGLAGGLLGAGSILAALRYVQGKPVSSPQPIRPEMWRELLAYIMPTVPTTIVYIVEGPLVLWLAMTFGGNAPVSETFAVGRISAIYALIGNFTIAVVAPRLAGIRDDVHFIRMATYYLFCLVLLCVVATMVAYLAPSILLLLIGDRYAHLQHEVMLSMTAASVWLLISFLAIANRLRGWVRLEPANATCQVIAIFALTSQWSFHDAASVLSLMLVLSGVTLLCTFTTSVVGLLAPNLVKAR